MFRLTYESLKVLTDSGPRDHFFKSQMNLLDSGQVLLRSRPWDSSLHPEGRFLNHFNTCQELEGLVLEVYGST